MRDLVVRLVCAVLLSSSLAWSQEDAEFTSERAWSKDGYLSGYGLVPMREDERRMYAAVAKSLSVMTR